MNYFRCTVGGSGKGNTVTVTCADEFAGQPITLAKIGKTYTKTCPSTSPYVVTFYGVENGTYMVSATMSGQTYSTEVIVQDVSCVLNYGFRWQTWVDTAQFLDSTDYDSLSEVLEDEEALRELFLEHACVDYMASSTSSVPDLETIIENDLCAKWINLCDYALDFLGANEVIADLMDEADKYGYGEWCLMPQVPKMTSNTAPYGEVIGDEYYQSYYKYYAFDGDPTSFWTSKNNNSGHYIGYKFANPVKALKFANTRRYYTGDPQTTISAKVQASNDGTNWTDLTDDFSLILNDVNSTGIVDEYDLTKNLGYYLYYRVLFGAGSLVWPCTAGVQFYSYAPKGNVPVMTSNTAPYGEAFCGNSYTGGPYSAFDGDDSTYWYPGNSADQYIGYKFTNPVCVKRFVFKFLEYARAITPFTPKLQASNDGSTWETVWESPQAIAETGTYDIKANNDDYYIYWRLWTGLVFVASQSTDFINALQFYGRELKVSVPTMTSNTAPFGEAIGEWISSNHNGNFYTVFDGNDTSEISDQVWIGYKFIDPIVIKGCLLITRTNYQQTGQFMYSIRGSNTGYDADWDDLATGITINSGNNVKKWVSFENNASYKYYGLFKTQDGTWGGFATVQFYGLDYSEKEFEVGTTKKWLYDHGVELVQLANPITFKDGFVEKRADEILYGINSYNSGAALFADNAIDLTDYQYMRAKTGLEAYTSDAYQCAIGVKANKTFSASDYTMIASMDLKPLSNGKYNWALDISSVTSSNYVALMLLDLSGSGTHVRKDTVSEWWLEQ